MLNNIQVLRAFAALNVVLYHVIATAASYGQEVFLFSILQGWGKNGVDVFFVISGFVMVYTQAVNAKPAQVFIVNRILRIVPLYWFFTLCLLVICLFAPFLFRDLRPTFPHALSSFLLITGITVELPPLVHVGWTLEYEMLFYVLFALGLLLKREVFSLAFVVIALLVLMESGLTDPIVIEFALGMACAKLYLARKGRALGPAFLALGVLLLSVTIFIDVNLHRAIVFGLPALLIVFGSAYTRQISNKLLIYLGAASYSIYLVQAFTISAFYKLSSMFLTFLPTDALAVIAVCFTAALGCATYELVEKPLSRILSNDRKNDEHKAVGATPRPAEETTG